MKKVTSLVLSIVFLLTLFGDTSFAQSASLDGKIIYRADEITDIDLLFERAKMESLMKQIITSRSTCQYLGRYRIMM